MLTAVCGSTTQRCFPKTSRIVAKVSSVPTAAEAMPSSMGLPSSSAASPLAAKSAMNLRTRSASPPKRKCRKRSKLLATWMSMDGLIVWRTWPRL